MRYEVYYQRHFSGMPQPFSDSTHQHVADIEAADLEEAFSLLQAETVTPALKSCILKSGIKHLSMSVGDVLVDEQGQAFMCLPLGFGNVQRAT